jgi:xanthine phosphoribosyltransferase
MKKLIITAEDHQQLISKICRDIAVRDNWRPDYVVGITRGGLVPAVMISHYFDVPCHTLKVSLRDGDQSECESNFWMSEDAFGYVGKEQRNDDNPSDPAARKNILIVDDINDSGDTLNWIMKDWESSCLPSSDEWITIWNNNVRFAAVVDNLDSRCTVGIDYVGKEINKAEDDVWVVFPWESWYQ